MLSAGPTPHATATWSLTIDGAVDEAETWTWDELRALPPETITVDIHCVTKWTKLDTVWEGVSLDTLLEASPPTAQFVDRLLRRRLHHQPAAGGPHRRQGLGRLRATTASRWSPSTAGPARLLVPHLYFWKSAKWVRGLTLIGEDEPGFWESLGYHNYGDPWREQRYAGD